MPPARASTRSPAAAAAEFEYCELCRRNHDQGRRHRYFPAHRAALAAALSRFRSRLSDLRRAFQHGGAAPSSAPPAHPRLWCPFCSGDLVDLDGGPNCDAMHHLASNEHLKAVKDFLRKHGGAMDQVDSLRVPEDELAKWKKGRGSLSTGAQKGTEGLIGPSLGPMKAMGLPVLLVQRVKELPVLEPIFILLHMELSGCPSRLRDRPRHMSSSVC